MSIWDQPAPAPEMPDWQRTLIDAVNAEASAAEERMGLAAAERLAMARDNIEQSQQRTKELRALLGQPAAPG